MKKSELITLLECIKLRNEDDVKFFLKLDEKEIKILIDNKEKAQFLYNIIRKFKNSNHYECILKNAIEIKDKRLYEPYKDLVIKHQSQSREKFTYIIETVMQVKDFEKIIGIINLLTLKSSIVRDVVIKNEINKIVTLDIEQINLISKIIKYDSATNWKNSINLMKRVYGIKDKNILNNLINIFEKVLSFLYTSDKYEVINNVFDSIEEILKINNVEIINNVLEDILNEMQKEQKTKEISIFDKTKELIEERNIVSVILKLDKKALLDGLNVLSDDEEITQNTYVKKHIL